MKFKCLYTNCVLCERFLLKEFNKRHGLYLCQSCGEICYKKPKILKVLKEDIK
jgi:hypothetical protein